MNEEEVLAAYGDIIDHLHHVSAKHKQMAMIDRAAQFSPFAALTGHSDAIEEARIETESEEDVEHIATF